MMFTDMRSCSHQTLTIHDPPKALNVYAETFVSSGPMRQNWGAPWTSKYELLDDRSSWTLTDVVHVLVLRLAHYLQI